MKLLLCLIKFYEEEAAIRITSKLVDKAIKVSKASKYKCSIHREGNPPPPPLLLPHVKRLVVVSIYI